MTDVPRRLPLTQAERLRTLADGQAGGSNRGSTRFGKRPERRRTTGQQTPGGSIVVVVHGDDPTVERPDAEIVYWLGAATPSTAAAYDFWYTANV